ncbi:hypothetical protein [Flavisphingomonas formosensis]|uniref:hypothetical protein n=1 Tax=Flavisphingomonas formosensis TaxID=861534 RepID=UPI0018DF511A|nr:hypothetical protein [Sphingomonas formosensis]
MGGDVQCGDGPIDRKVPEQPLLLNATRCAALVKATERGSLAAVHDVVCRRIVDLAQMCAWMGDHDRHYFILRNEKVQRAAIIVNPQIDQSSGVEREWTRPPDRRNAS